MNDDLHRAKGLWELVYIEDLESGDRYPLGSVELKEQNSKLLNQTRVAQDEIKQLVTEFMERHAELFMKVMDYLVLLATFREECGARSTGHTRNADGRFCNNCGLPLPPEPIRVVSALGPQPGLQGYRERRDNPTIGITFASQEGAPSCADCGSLMTRQTTGYKCLNCGSLATLTQEMSGPEYFGDT